MPVLLAPEQAPSLQALLAQANTIGLDCKPIITPGTAEPHIRGLGSLTSAGPQEVSFLSNPKLHDQLLTSRAAAIVMTQEAWEQLPAESFPWQAVICTEPYLMYALLAQWFDQHRVQQLDTGIHPTAVIASSAVIGDGVSIGPHCVVEQGARIGAGTRLGPGCVIGTNSSLGNDCLLHARVTLYHNVNVGDRAILHTGSVFGADGFGFAPDPHKEPGAWAKIAQIGGLVMGDDVEIGANTTVDRGALENTIIGNGVKLDNQIMIGHNCQIGDHTAMAACVGVAGSTIIGRRCTIAGAGMLSGHLVLADDVHVSGGTAITSDISKPGRYTGVFPYAEHGQWQRNAAVLSQLSQIRRRLMALEKDNK